MELQFLIEYLFVLGCMLIGFTVTMSYSWDVYCFKIMRNSVDSGFNICLNDFSFRTTPHLPRAKLDKTLLQTTFRNPFPSRYEQHGNTPPRWFQSREKTPTFERIYKPSLMSNFTLLQLHAESTFKIYTFHYE